MMMFRTMKGAVLLHNNFSINFSNIIDDILLLKFKNKRNLIYILLL